MMGTRKKPSLLRTTPAQRKAILKRYMLFKYEIEDWHAIADVACDLRELESKYPWLKKAHQPG